MACFQLSWKQYFLTRDLFHESLIHCWPANSILTIHIISLKFSNYMSAVSRLRIPFFFEFSKSDMRTVRYHEYPFIYHHRIHIFFLMFTSENKSNFFFYFCYKCSDLKIYHFSSRITLYTTLACFEWKILQESRKKFAEWWESLVNSRAQHKHENWKWSRCSTPIL